MIFPDYHLHSSFSTDSQADIHDILKKAIEKGMTSLCITDHYDMDFPVRPDEPYMNFYLDTDTYYRYMSDIREQYRDKIDLKIGVELGVMDNISKKLDDYAEKHSELDFIIASSHLADGLDPYYPEYFEGKTDNEAYYRYFETILDNVRSFKNFDVYGHLDYIMRYGKNKADNFDIREYRELFRDIFSIIIPAGKGIEINTGSLYKGLSFPHPHKDILQIYRDMGGEIITVGSDAHQPKYIGYGFDIARDVLKACGFKYYCTYDKRKPVLYNCFTVSVPKTAPV